MSPEIRDIKEALIICFFFSVHYPNLLDRLHHGHLFEISAKLCSIMYESRQQQMFFFSKFIFRLTES